MRRLGSREIFFALLVLTLWFVWRSDQGRAQGRESRTPELKADYPPRGAGKAAEAAPTAEGPVLKAIRHISSRTYTRIIMDLSGEVPYETHILKGESARGLPTRIYVDLFGARLVDDVQRQIVVQDRFLRQIRAGQFRPEVVRVVLDMKSLGSHKTFLLPDPFRLLLDVQEGGNGGPGVRERAEVIPPGRTLKDGGPGIKKIVLDPGHGGKDPGAIGPRGIAEKDIVLKLAKKLARKLRTKMGVRVILTRNDDSYIPLEDRTAIANAENADLFISLHTNASPNRRLTGIESYYLDNTTDEAAVRLAARENGTSRRKISDLQFILSDLTQNSKLEDSVGLAHHIQSNLVSHMRRKYRRVKDLGVKKGLFYVLVGARMPSVLVEAFFITNRYDARSLARRSFQNAVVEALYRGIERYRESTRVARNL